MLKMEIGFSNSFKLYMNYKLIIKRIALVLMGLFSLLFLFKEFLLSELNPAVDHGIFNGQVEEIKNMESLPDIFIQKADEVVIFQNYNKQILNEVFSFSKGWCPCEGLENQGLFGALPKSRILLNSKVMSLKFQRELTIEQCFTYKMTESDFGYGIRGVKNAAVYYFNKPLTELGKAEIYALIQMTKNSRRFNIQRSP